MKEFPLRLEHDTPAWIGDRALFHIWIRVAPEQRTLLDAVELGAPLLSSVRNYHASGRWSCVLFLIMPDHVHALLGFPRDPGMSESIRTWKRGTARFQGVRWQSNYFDHRIRTRAEALEKWHYIRLNPVAKSLCARAEEWRWWWSGANEAR